MPSLNKKIVISPKITTDMTALLPKKALIIDSFFNLYGFMELDL